ncbi:MAG: response regulator [Clostridiaceae bacterium]
MKLYRLLIVDDEPHVANAIITLLESQTDLPLDIYFAYSGKQAIEIIKKGKIDLLMTDIQMPDMSGIELVDIVNQYWPICKTIFLTAYSDFNYAYQAIRKHVVSYILKAEDDDFILQEVRKALRFIDDEFNQRQALAQAKLSSEKQRHPVSRNLFFHLLTHGSSPGEDIQPYISMFGYREPMNNLFLLLGIVKSDNLPGKDDLHESDTTYPEYAFIIQDILNHYMGEWIRHSVFELDESGRLVWIVQLDETGNHDVNNSGFHTPQWLSGMLETVQFSCRATAGIEVSFVMSSTITDPCHMSKVYSSTKAHALRLAASTEPYVYICIPDNEPVQSALSTGHQDEDLMGGTIQFLKDYINTNIGGDVSLMQLSAVTGYNDTYLSNIFHKQTGELLYRYIMRKKLEMISNLLKDAGLTIEAVAERAGFNSRPYFNRFIKKETGLTPRNFRMKLLNQCRDN